MTDRREFLIGLLAMASAVNLPGQAAAMPMPFALQSFQCIIPEAARCTNTLRLAALARAGNCLILGVTGHGLKSVTDNTGNSWCITEHTDEDGLASSYAWVSNIEPGIQDVTLTLARPDGCRVQILELEGVAP